MHPHECLNEMCNGKLIRNIECRNPGFLTKGYIDMILEDPRTGERYKVRITAG